MVQRETQELCIGVCGTGALVGGALHGKQMYTESRALVFLTSEGAGMARGIARGCFAKSVRSSF